MSRPRLSLDGTWHFFLDPKQRLSHEALDDQAPRAIQVPGPWQAQFDDLRDYSGVAWYRRTFEMTGIGYRVPDTDDANTQHPAPNTYMLHFGAVDYHATVWLNGQLLGEHEGGYLPFELDASAALRADGPNELVVRVADPGADATQFPEFPFAEVPHGKQSWYGPIGGLWQSVYLEARAATHISRIQVTPDVPGEQARVTVYLNQPAPSGLNLALRLTDPRGETSTHEHSLDAGAAQADITLPIAQPVLWDIGQPNLYLLAVSLRDQGRTTKDEGSQASDSPSSSVLRHSSAASDSAAATFGMRTIATSPEGQLLLNGRIIYLRGALDQDYYPELIYTPFSDAQIADQFAKAQHMGLNCLRTHIKITDPRYYDAADRAGLLIWTELPNWQNLTAAAKRRARATLAGMVERDWNHPSIVIWTIINENWGTDLGVNADHRAWLSETYDYLKALDPHRLVVGNSACYGNFQVVTDILDFHNYYAIPDHYRKWREWVETFASRPDWAYAHSYADFEEWQKLRGDFWKPGPRTHTPEVRTTGHEPLVVSEFGNWGLPDMAKLRAGYGGNDPWWFETGMEWGSGVVYPHGVDQRFKTFHLDKVFPTLSDLTAASQRMQFAAMKYEIEQMRLHPSIVGYVITEFTDVHWECNGLLDMCRNPKIYHDVIATINADDVIVPEIERAAVWVGQPCEVQLTLSHFSGADLAGARLEWRLDRWPEIGGVFENIACAQGQVATVGSATFEAPAVEQGTCARVELRLVGANGATLAGNHQDVYVLPRAAGAANARTKIYAPELAGALEDLGYQTVGALEQADVALATTMTDALREYVQGGGQVLWLAEQADSQQAYLRGVGIAPRAGRGWEGDWASNFNWIRQDRMFQHIPTGGTVDFAFADLIPDTVIVGMGPAEFEGDVHAGLFVGWLHDTVALVAERQIASGRLLISTFQLSQHLHNHPVAQVMLRDLLAYVTR
ncbi:MAG TPA: glycoside hydrolase family 2 TIM barrel-domain containing protein [Roseiflexaceae bacterium]|nr:glycoside hydrolase family 2 TIM barrel-domain containing protein [Roseiflexaceae bacterium]